MSVDVQSLADALARLGPFTVELGDSYVDLIDPTTSTLVETVSVENGVVAWDAYTSSETDVDEVAGEILYSLRDVV